jgi:hypothetical protein
LRKNAVNALLEAGCTPHETASITGQSVQMVEHYAKKVSQKKLGKSAMLKFERATGTKREEENCGENSEKNQKKSVF